MNSGQQYRRLAKSRSDRMIDGVCGGVAAYFGVDPTLVRVAWVLGTLLGGSGILLYIAAMILMPKEAMSEVPPSAEPVADPTAPRSSARNNTRFWGILLVGIGVVWLMGNLGWDFWHHWWWLSFGTVVPILMILAGVAFLYGGREYFTGTPAAAAVPMAEPQAAMPPASARLMRSRADKKIAGVCGGIGTYLQIDGVIIRLAFIMAGIASFGFMLLVYLVLAIAVPLEPEMPAVQTAAVS